MTQNQVPPPSAGAQYLHSLLQQAQHLNSVLIDHIAAQDARIADLEKNQKKPKS